MPQVLTEEEARKKLCPLSFAAGCMQRTECVASRCALWEPEQTGAKYAESGWPVMGGYCGLKK